MLLHACYVPYYYGLNLSHYDSLLSVILGSNLTTLQVYLHLLK